MACSENTGIWLIRVDKMVGLVLGDQQGQLGTKSNYCKGENRLGPAFVFKTANPHSNETSTGQMGSLLLNAQSISCLTTTVSGFNGRFMALAKWS